MAMVSSAIFCRDSWSFLFLYFFWTACSSGETICIARDARICRTNSGMISVRITTVRPTIDSTQVQPESGRSEEHTSELQSRGHLVYRLQLEKKKYLSSRHPPLHGRARVS